MFPTVNKRYYISKLTNLKKRQFSEKFHPLFIQILKIFNFLSTVYIFDLKRGIDEDELINQKGLGDYKKIQIFGSEQKFNNMNIVKHQKALKPIIPILASEINGQKTKFLCHGVRNGTELKAFSILLRDHDIDFMGTDINPQADKIENCVTHDFHEPISTNYGKFNIIYTNSLDQARNPKLALQSMYSDLYSGGLLILHFTEFHGKRGFATLDPFMCEIEFFPYLILKWFNFELKLSFISDEKYNRRGWYIIRK
jgi:hypothetical protein